MSITTTRNLLTFVAAFDGKGGTAFLTQESEVPAGCSHGRSFSAVPRVGRRIIASPQRSRVRSPFGRRAPSGQGRSRQRPLRWRLAVSSIVEDHREQ